MSVENLLGCIKHHGIFCADFPKSIHFQSKNAIHKSYQHEFVIGNTGIDLTLPCKFVIQLKLQLINSTNG